MGSLTCWCGYTIKDNDEPNNVGHILWNGSPPFYAKAAELLRAFSKADAEGNGHDWVEKHFSFPYPCYPDEISAESVAHDLVDQASEDHCSGVYRCPRCRRMYIHVQGTENKWESFVSEQRISGDE